MRAYIDKAKPPFSQRLRPWQGVWLGNVMIREILSFMNFRYLRRFYGKPA
jgi:hypothetical protein